MDQPRYRWISARVRPKEDYRFVTGRGHFAADVRLPGMTRVATVPSAHAHARIVSIDLTAALAVPGGPVAPVAPFAPRLPFRALSTLGLICLVELIR